MDHQSELTARRRDADVVRGLPDVVRVYPNPSYWWQNASFALPLLVTVVSLVVGFAFGITEAIGFGLFGAVVTLIMIPVVMLTWRSTATSIVLTRTGAMSLHEGKPLHRLDWSELRRIERVEYLGNTRYKLVHGDDDEYLVVESEIEGGEALVEEAFELSGIPRQSSEPAPERN
ncbi:MAG: hypothetical protein AB7F65_01495 [Dehalococcoidia bacterium]